MKKIIYTFGLCMMLSACAAAGAQTTASSAASSSVAEHSPANGDSVHSDSTSNASTTNGQSDVSGEHTSTEGEQTAPAGVYREMEQEEAIKLLKENTDLILLDVRTAEEYSSGHIPNSIHLPNEEITDVEPEILPDKDQLILVYCRSGNRSTQAAKKLIDMGYTNVYNIGGINTWPGEIVQ